MLVDLSEKPTLSPQQLQDSAEEISKNFPTLLAAIEASRSGLAEDLITTQQITESNMQKNFDQISKDLSDGNALQRSISIQAQEEAQSQESWRSQFQISIREIQAQAQQHFEALEGVRLAQEVNHQHNICCIPACCQHS